MTQRNRGNRRSWKIAFVLIGICFAIFLVTLYRYIAFNLWLESDARRLERYPRVLIEQSREIQDPALESPGMEDTRQIERALCKSGTADRLVVHLSRSDIRYDLFRRKAFVKVFLETAFPGQPDRIQRIKFLDVLARQNGKWDVIQVEELTIP